jgi:hypothetical protein
MNIDERKVPVYAGWADSTISIADIICLPIVSTQYWEKADKVARQDHPFLSTSTTPCGNPHPLWRDCRYSWVLYIPLAVGGFTWTKNPGMKVRLILCPSILSSD